MSGISAGEGEADLGRGVGDGDLSRRPLRSASVEGRAERGGGFAERCVADAEDELSET